MNTDFETKHKELEDLFADWIERMKVNGDASFTVNGDVLFTKDGIMYQNAVSEEQSWKDWDKSTKRIMFILKDQNQGNEKWPEDIRYWLKDEDSDKESAIKQKKENRELGNSFIKHIAYIFWGLTKVDKQNDWQYEDVVKHEEEVKEFFNTQPFALVECKKQPGEGGLYNKVLRQNLKNYGDLLIKEIEILNPNMIVCTSPIIYKYILKSLPQEGSTQLILSSYHPSAFGRYAGKAHYDHAVNQYRALLK